MDPKEIKPARTTQETFTVIDYREIRRLAEEVLGMPDYNVVYASEWENDSINEVVLDREEWLNPEYEDRAAMRLYLADAEASAQTEDPDDLDIMFGDVEDEGFQPEAWHIMAHLAELGGYGITWGTYLVRVSW